MKTKLIRVFTSVALLWVSSTQISFSQDLYFPPQTGTWDTVSQDDVEYCSDVVDSLYDFLEYHRTKSFILLESGKIGLEQYFGSHGVDSVSSWFSAGKTLTATLVGIAQEEGYLSISDKTSDHLGKWSSLSQEKEDLITIWHQLTMTSGLDESDLYCTDSSCLKYKADAGKRWYYHNAPYNLLRPVLENSTGMGLNRYTDTRIENKIGMSGFWLPVGYNNFYISNARSMARYGLMIQANGIWDTDTVLGDSKYIRDMTTSSQDLNPSYGYLWWLNGYDSFIPPEQATPIRTSFLSYGPKNAYMAVGYQGQIISVSPDQNYLFVRQGNDPRIELNEFISEVFGFIDRMKCTTTSIASPSNPKPRLLTGQDYIAISTTESISSIKLTDLFGRKIIEVKDTDRVATTTLSSGTYIVTVEINDGNLFAFKYQKQ